MCGKCDKEKPLEEFRKCNRTRDHLFNWCRTCQDDRNKYLYTKNKQKRLAQIVKWNSEHPDKIKAYKSNWRKNKESNP